MIADTADLFAELGKAAGGLSCARGYLLRPSTPISRSWAISDSRPGLHRSGAAALANYGRSILLKSSRSMGGLWPEQLRPLARDVLYPIRLWGASLAFQGLCRGFPWRQLRAPA